jgi:soluble lytic murein transglycosylase
MKCSIVFGLVSVLGLASCAVQRAAVQAVVPEQAAAVGTNAERFAEAYEGLRREQYEPALTTFTALTATYPELMDYHLYYIGIIHVRRQETQPAQVTFTRLLAEYPQSVKADEASLELGKILAQQGDYGGATSFLERAAACERPSVRYAGKFALAEMSAERGDPSSAYRDLMALRRDARGTSAARDAKKAVLRLRQRYRSLEPTGSELLDEAKLFLDERDYAGAALALDRLEQESPPDVDAAAVARVQAETLLGRGRLEEALAALWRVADDYPQTSAAPAALFRLASLLWNRDRDTAAMRAFDELRSRYPRDSRVPDAIYAIGRIYDSAGRESEAIEAYTEVVRRFPRHDLAAESKWRIGWIHYRAGRWDEATAAFAALAESSSGKRHDEGMYWRARAHENAGRDDRARHLYQQVVAETDDSPYAAYYGAWAEARLQGLSRRERVAEPFADGGQAIAAPMAAEPVAPSSLPQFHVERWRELRAAELNELARHELTAIASGAPEDAATTKFLIDAYQDVDDFRRVRALVNRGAGLSARERRELLYPLGFWSEVSHEATARGVDPIWVVSLMRQESMFDPAAVSPVGARGLMQLMPATAERVAAELGRNVADESDLLDPQFNVALGTAYLRSLSDRFGSDMLKALAAYNGGESAVERWRQQFGGLAPDEFVESITYRETRDYVKRVAGNYRVYRQLYRVGEP